MMVSMAGAAGIPAFGWNAVPILINISTRPAKQVSGMYFITQWPVWGFRPYKRYYLYTKWPKRRVPAVRLMGKRMADFPMKAKRIGKPP